MLPGDLLFAAHREVFLPSGTKVVDPRFVIAHRANSARASLALLDNLPLRRFAPPPHEWGGQGRTTCGDTSHEWRGQPAPPSPAATPPHKWGGQGRTGEDNLRRYLP